jgi:hypothetical protein
MTKRLSESERARRVSQRRANKEIKTKAYSETYNKPTQTRLRDKKGRFKSTTGKRRVSGYWKLVKKVKSMDKSDRSKKEKNTYARNYIKEYTKEGNSYRITQGQSRDNWHILARAIKRRHERGIDTLPRVS